jgi:hypothetical protein
MKLFECQYWGQLLDFENTRCKSDDLELGLTFDFLDSSGSRFQEEVRVTTGHVAVQQVASQADLLRLGERSSLRLRLDL